MPCGSRALNPAALSSPTGSASAQAGSCNSAKSVARSAPGWILGAAQLSRFGSTALTLDRLCCGTRCIPRCECSVKQSLYLDFPFLPEAGRVPETGQIVQSSGRPDRRRAWIVPSLFRPARTVARAPEPVSLQGRAAGRS
jgi:hypothetical protein